MEELLSRTQTRKFPPEAVIIEEGEMGDSMFIMLSGEVAITKRIILGLAEDIPKERVMSRLKAEDGVYFEELTLFEGRYNGGPIIAGLSQIRVLTSAGNKDIHFDVEGFAELMEKKLEGYL